MRSDDSGDECNISVPRPLPNGGSETHKQTVADYFMLPNFGRSFISVRMLMWDTAA
jgi:hypothetical protein